MCIYYDCVFGHIHFVVFFVFFADIDDDLLAELLSDSDDEEKKVKQTAEQAAAIEPATGDSVTSLDTVSAEASSNAEDKEEMKMPTFSAEPVLPPVKGKKSDSREREREKERERGRRGELNEVQLQLHQNNGVEKTLLN